MKNLAKLEGEEINHFNVRNGVETIEEKQVQRHTTILR